MKVAIFHPHFDSPRGAEKVCLTHAHALREFGWDVRLLAFDWKPQEFSAADRDLNPVFLPAPRRLWDGRPDPATIAALTAAIADRDVAVAHNYPASMYLGHATRDVPRGWYCEEPFRALYIPETRPGLQRAFGDGRVDAAAPIGRYYRRELRKSFWNLALNPRYRGKRRHDQAGVAGLDAVAANSAATAAVFASIYGREASVLYCPVEFPANLPPPAADGPLRILTQGGFAPLKGLAMLLAGYEQFLRSSRRPVLLEIVGAGRERADIERLIAGTRTAACVRIHGWISNEQLAGLRSQCHGFAAMPADEPFGLVFAEALAAGLVAIGPDHGGPAEILGGGEFGLIADPFTPASVADALRRLADMDFNARGELRERAFVAARRRFDVRMLPLQLDGWLRSVQRAATTRR
jgi:glycosyltransferase involved in cell wall biosynthesis